MGFIRHFLLSVCVILFFCGLLAMNLFLTISFSLDYDTLKPKVMSLSENVLIDNSKVDYINNELDTIRNYCRAHSELIESFSGMNFSIACEKVSEGPDVVVDTVIEQQDLLTKQEENFLREQVNRDYSYYVEYCNAHTDFMLDEIQDLEDKLNPEAIKIGCDTIESDIQDIMREVISDYFDVIYYKDYVCDFSVETLFFDCFMKYKSPFFLLSEQARDYWHDKFSSLLIINTVLAGLIFLFVEKKSNWFIVVGVFSIISALPFLDLGWLMWLLDNKYLEIYSAIFTQYHKTFLISFLFGMIMIGIGMSFKFLKLGSYISRKFWAVENKINQFKDKRNNKVVKKESKAI